MVAVYSLAIDHFDTQASNAVLDLTGDDTTMEKGKKMKKTW